MYLIVAYDAAPKRGAKLLKFLRQKLIWVQNSFFEGEVTDAGFESILAGLKEIINKQKDCVIIYKFDSKNYAERKILGTEKNDTDNFI